MSSVIAALDDTQVILATDTLCTVKAGPGTAYLATKAFLLPHMNMLMASSGSTHFLERWWMYLNTKHIFPGIETLMGHSQELLAEVWEELKRDQPWPEYMEREQAIYHFGLSEFTGEMLGFAQISWNGFKPDEISYRVRGDAMVMSKPKCTMPNVQSMADFPRVMLAMMEEQRANQAANAYGLTGPEAGRVTIGGELQIHHMNKTGCAVYKLARFDDFDAVEKALWGDRAEWKKFCLPEVHADASL